MKSIEVKAFSLDELEKLAFHRALRSVKSEFLNKTELKPIEDMAIAELNRRGYTVGNKEDSSLSFNLSFYFSSPQEPVLDLDWNGPIEVDQLVARLLPYLTESERAYFIDALSRANSLPYVENKQIRNLSEGSFRQTFLNNLLDEFDNWTNIIEVEAKFIIEGKSEYGLLIRPGEASSIVRFDRKENPERFMLAEDLFSCYEKWLFIFHHFDRIIENDLAETRQAIIDLLKEHIQSLVETKVFTEKGYPLN